MKTQHVKDYGTQSKQCRGENLRNNAYIRKEEKS